ncbi:class I SAM-dependent methyltransferase [Shimwellia pseudoproteus]|uniref:methyltransferase domain-containing protein n=1 Tax=Shimwellia pseudoproteus TaxID=570012 RepID=UPI0018ECD48F|nr:class I SAM-dependent methyltransferase [Shimwellia pseudoproteus]MBJ3813712.1 class I SAM-dependent methyltransferase [Shimwellia pseudoproteus]
MTFPARELLADWDAQQSAYIAHREARFTAVLDVLAMLYGDGFHVLDLGCGPGSFSLRLLERFPNARITAVDLDPLLLTLARHALVEYRERIQFIHADIAAPDWSAAIPGAPQAVVSSTAIHWLLPEQQVVLYRTLAGLLDDGGVLINADHQRFTSRHPRQKALAEQHDHHTQQQAFAQGALDWDAWFTQALRWPPLKALQQAREQRFSGRPAPFPTSIAVQLALLDQAGFSETGTLWQFLDDYAVAGWK